MTEGAGASRGRERRKGFGLVEPCRREVRLQPKRVWRGTEDAPKTEGL